MLLCDSVHVVRPKKKSRVLPATRPTQNFPADPKVFFCGVMTFSLVQPKVFRKKQRKKFQEQLKCHSNEAINQCFSLDN